MDQERLLSPKKFYERLDIKKTAIKDRQNPKSPRYDPDCPKPTFLAPNCPRYLDSETTSYIAILKARRDAQHPKGNLKQLPRPIIAEPAALPA